MSTIRICDGISRMPQWRLVGPVDFSLEDGEQLAIVGPNGGGKSLLVDMITGRHPLLGAEPEYDFGPGAKPLVSDNLRYMAFRDSYGGETDTTYYLQQRWNQQEMSDDMPTAGQRLEEAFAMSGPDTPSRRQLQRRIYQTLGLESQLDKRVVLLSSGELRKLLLACALFAEPRVLIMDNPFIGLDAPTRLQLRQLLARLTHGGRLQVVLVLSKTDDLPDFITHVVGVEGLRVGRKLPRSQYLSARKPLPSRVLPAEAERLIAGLPPHSDDYRAQTVVKLNNVAISYGHRTILGPLSWTVNRGEHWALSGRNGSGKSTLLSLVCADNPQAYAHDITLFDRQRGSGESIWDIKRHIGYVSPEMHRAYKRNIATVKVVASGLKDSVGLYAHPTERELAQCRLWMRVLGIGQLAGRPFLTLSSGEQRLALLARAFVKDPELLILDEPLHGLDDRNRQMVKEVIDTFCRRKGKTLIMVSHYREEYPQCIDHELVLGDSNDLQ